MVVFSLTVNYFQRYKGSRFLANRAPIFPMKNLFVAGLMLAGAVAPAAAADVLPLADVRPGMRGIGVTVFEGTTRAEFDVEIIGILHNINGPKRNLILARLDGGPLAETGVIAGMSGSPVYVEGRLVGAVAYAMGSFTTEPLAGITPIEEMFDAVDVPGVRPAAVRARVEVPLSPDRLIALFRASMRPTAAFARSTGVVAGIGPPLREAQSVATMLRPIATPLSLSGFDREVADLLTSALDGTGLVPVLGGGQAGSAPVAAEPLQAGDAVSVSLIDGDLSLAGTGTVTLVENDRVYAFGHPFQNLGPTQFVMNRAHIQALLPSLLSSTKIATVGEAIGTFEQDRLTAIAGTLGPAPRRIPVTVTLRPSAGNAAVRELQFNIVDDQVLTPLLTFVTVLNTLRAYERGAGAATLAVAGTATFQNHAPLAFDDVFSGNGPSLAAATSVLTPITFLVQNGFAPIALAGLRLEITASEDDQRAQIERVWLDERRVRPGREATLKIATRSHRGAEEVHTLPIRIPANAPSTVSLFVAGGTELAQLERQETQGRVQPRNLNQLIRILNEGRRNNRLYVRLLAADSGAVVAGEPLTALPPSALAVYQSDRSRGTVTPLRRTTLADWELGTSEAISGSRVLTLNLDAR